MSSSLEQTVAQLLADNRIPVSRKYLQRQLRTHADYPSLASVTDLLEKLNVPHAALQVEQENIDEIPTPFLAYLEGVVVDPDRPSNVETPEGTKQVPTGKSAELVVVDDARTVTQRHADFYDRWKGVVLAVEAGAVPTEADNTQQNLGESVLRWAQYALAFTFSLAAIFALTNSFSWTNVLLLVTSGLGIGAGALIFEQERGHSNKISEHVCKAVAPVGCGRVLQSSAAQIFGWLKLSDVGLIYFASLAVALILAGSFWNISAVKSAWSILAASSILFMLFSIYYQWRVLKSWCGLCLIVVGLLVIQMALLGPSLASLAAQERLARANVESAGIFIALVITAVAAGWLILRQIITINDRLEREIIPLLRLKRSPETFLGLLGREHTVNTAPVAHDLQLGNPLAPVQLTVACNLYCAPCGRTHIILDRLLDDESVDIGLTIRFLVKADDESNLATRSLTYVLQYLSAPAGASDAEQWRARARKAIHDWYEVMDLEKFAATHAVTAKPDVRNALQFHEEWSKDAKIRYTPTIFINGAELPKAYAPGDLRWISQIMAESERTMPA